MTEPLEYLKGTVLKNVEDVILKGSQIAELKNEQIKHGSDLCQ